MTQSYNLSQLANNLNSSGQLLAASGLNGAVPISNGGTGATSAVNARINLDVAQAVYAVPSGGIIMWSGTIAAIPTGWLLCNGTSGTPDLRNRFIIGASVDNAGVANTSITGSNTQSGGSKDAIVPYHSHTITDPGHAHTFNNYSTTSGGATSPIIGNSNSIASTSTNSASTGITATNFAGTSGNATNANLVPYFALAFIMKS
jgi:microcystin-dependent protein